MKKNRHLRDFLVLTLILAAVTAAFWPSLFNGFTSWDDNIHLLENERIRNLSWPAIRTIFTTDVSLTYIPLTALSFAVEHHFFGYDPFIYHLDNLLLHLGVISLIFIFVLRLCSSVTIAAAAATVFGLHPMHVESVAWVTERKDVLYAFFYMASLNFYLGYMRSLKINRYVMSLLCGLLSILAKPMALSLPLVLFLLDWFYGRKFSFRGLLEKVPFFAVVVPIAWLTYDLHSRLIQFRFPGSLLTWVWTLTFYLRKFLFPVELLPLYQLPEPVKITHPEFLTALGVLALMAAVIIRFKKDRWVIFAFLFFFLSIFFLLRFDSRADLNIVADRFMYLPSFGFCLLLGVYVKRLLVWSNDKQNARKLAVAGLAAIVSFWAVSTYQQTKIWGDQIKFWDMVIAEYPGNYLAHNERALAHKAAGDLEKALQDYDRAIALFPRYDFALTNRGIIFKELRRYDEALADHSLAIDVNPDFSEAYLNRGNVYFEMRDYPAAIRDYDQAIMTHTISGRRNSTLYRADVYSHRGSAYFFMKDHPSALRDYDRALAIDPNNIVALDNRAIIYSESGRLEEAFKDFAKAIALDPRKPARFTNRAILFHRAGNDTAALQDLRAALSLKPDHQRALQLKREIEAAK